MTRLVSLLIYYFLYSLLYMSPLILIMLVAEGLRLDVQHYLNRLGPLRQILGFVVLAYAMILPGYRAKLASDAYGGRDMPFWEAHSVSGSILKVHLSFLPVVGKFFHQEKERCGADQTNRLK